MPGQDTGAIVDALWEGTGTPASLITEITSLDGTVSYSYDSAGQLLGATYTTGQTSEAYAYDAAGNRLAANGAAYLTGPNNQLLFDGVYSYLYDPEGNRTARYIDSNANGLLDAGDTSATTYAWDHRNRLTRVTDYATYGDPATRAVDYLYDTENRWIGRDVDLDANGIIDTRTRFAYDGNQIIMQFDRATTGDPTDPLTIDHLSHRYLWNPAAVDQLMADEHVTTPDSPGSILWPLADHLGTIRDLAAYDSSTDTTTVVNHRTFDAYGNLLSQSNPAHDTLFAFTGRPVDDVTGLQNNLHRWYDASTGRWMSEDPIGFEGRDGNLYAYVSNGPVNAVDPTGLTEAKSEWVLQLEEAMLYADLAEGAYWFEEGDMCRGWQVIDSKEYADGYRTVLYRRRGEGGTFEYVRAFAGTDQAVDWITNILQGKGAPTSQYARAQADAKRDLDAYGADSLHFVGHSLGGGLASTAAIVTGVRATVFNPAGVHFILSFFYPDNWASRQELITAYRVAGEMLTYYQDDMFLLNLLMPAAPRIVWPGLSEFGWPVVG